MARSVSLIFISLIANSVFLPDAAEILETRTTNGTDQQEYFVHYLNCTCALAVSVLADIARSSRSSE